MGFDGFFLSAEFIRRWEGEPPSEPNLSARCEVQFLRAQKIFFRQCRSTALQKFAVSPFASRYSQIAAVFLTPSSSFGRQRKGFPTGQGLRSSTLLKPLAF